MANNDRVAELYYRRIHSTEAQNACRDRVHWLCKHVEGRRVLDVGCSQGIVSIILAREGRTVIGLDVEAAAIEAAREALREESQPIQQRVDFRVEDAFTAQFEPGSFDTVIFGEVLEHLSAPERLLKRACEWLGPGGRVLVSVPHGYEPFDDHKHTFYLLRLVGLLAHWFEVLDIEPVHGKYLCAVGVRPADGGSPRTPAPDVLQAWTARCEDALELVQRAAHGEKVTLQADRKKLSERAAEYRERLENLQKAGNELRQQVRSTQAALTQEQAVRSDFERELSELRSLWKDATQREGELLRQLGQARAQAERLDAILQDEERLRQELKKTKSLYESEQQGYRQVAGQVERLKGQADYYKTELALREQEVRYQLGDALVRAARPSLDTLKLPFRFVRLLLTGLKRRRQRRRDAKRQEVGAAAMSASAASGAAEPRLPRGKRPEGRSPMIFGSVRGEDGVKQRATRGGQDAPQSADLDEISTLAQPYSSAPPELRWRNDLCLAAVTDEFSWRAWQYEADIYTFTPKTWQTALEQSKPDVLLVESTWSGIGNSWYFQLRDLGKRAEVIKYYALPDLVAWCRQRDIPTVFYNKEDPPNFDVFIDAAKQFDYVFTSDSNCIPAYRKHVGHDRVFALPFAAQPRIHNPIMTGIRTGSVCFAGTWYAHRHFARHDDADKILRPALNFDLHIFDRMANSQNPHYRWPDEYLTSVRGSLPYTQMLAAYKRYKVFLNINSVRNSPTMFSRRVFELLACGTPVISSYSDGIAQLLGADIVLMSDDEKTTQELLERVLGDDEYRDRLALRGQREVFSRHTYTNRLQSLLDAIGLTVPAVRRPVMTMIATVESAGQVAAAYETYRRQTYENKRLVVCATRPAATVNVNSVTSDEDGVRVITQEGATWGRLLQDAVRDCEEGFVVAVNPAHYYGPHYLTDYANATLYVTEPVIGKATFYEAKDGTQTTITKKGHEYRVVSAVTPWTLCLSRTQAIRAAARLGSAQTPYEWWNRTMRQFERAYSTDRFNYVQPGSVQAPQEQSPPTTSRFVAAEPREFEVALA